MHYLAHFHLKRVNKVNPITARRGGGGGGSGGSSNETESRST